ncbi:MAG: hypothetical protein K2N03_07320 [Muribaculaceae bacterium]|nr:hypothetical protein [Muribaculaceae bacterium]
MKKFLLSLAAICTMSLAAQADQLAITWSQEGYSNAADVTTVEKAPVTITCDKGTSNNAPKYYNTGTALRLYGGNTMTVSVESGYILNSVSFTTGSSNGFNAASTVTNGSFANNTWTASGDDVTSFTITQGGSSGHVRIETMTINYTQDLGNKEPAGIKFPVAAVDVVFGKTLTSDDFPPLRNPNKLTVTYSSTNEEVAKVNATTGAIEVVGVGSTDIVAESAATDVYAKGTASYTLTVVPAAKSLKQLLESSKAAGSGYKAYVDFRSQVMYQNGTYCYIKDVDDNVYSLIYEATNYETGTIIPSGWVATYSPYGDTPEYKMSKQPQAFSVVEPIYEEVTAVTTDMVNQVVVFRSVTFEEDTPATKTNFTGTLEDGTVLNFRNNFELSAEKAGTFDVAAAVALYNGAVQLYPIEYYIEVNFSTFITAKNAIDFTCEETEEGMYGLPGYEVSCISADNGPVEFSFTRPEGYNETYYIKAKGPEAMNLLKGKKISVKDEFIPYMENMFQGEKMVIGNTITVEPSESEYPEIYIYWFGNDGEISERDLYEMREIDIMVKPNPNSAVSEIEAEGEAVYYTLDGVKVANPENGVFVKVVNGKATTVVL